MCSIAAIYRPHPSDALHIQTMSATMVHRGPDQNGVFFDETICFAHNRLSVMDPESGLQPMTIVYNNRQYTIIYNGELYNTDELKADLTVKGAHFETRCDTEVLLWTYIFYGEDCPKHLNGIFAFLVYDHSQHKLFAARDRLGVKPLYYSICDERWLFASEPKALLAHPAVTAKVDREGLWELLFLTPVTTEESAIFRDIKQIRAGERLILSPSGIKRDFYWRLEAKLCRHSLEEAVEQTKYLLQDAVRRQIVSDVPLCTFLSGGLDSSVISAIAAKALREKGEVLSTYSFEYEGNRENFHSTLFQPQGDDAYAERLAADLATSHTVLTAPTRSVADLLGEAAIFRDLPGQADIDSSLLFFCREVKKRHTVALSGECSDEIFGGYPWFYRPEMLYRDFFPWIHEPFARAKLFRSKAIDPEEGYAYLSGEYRRFLADCPVIEGESDADRTARLATCLSVRYFMQNLLMRKDRMSMAAAVEVRVPFADHRIIEYVYNLPWAYKYDDSPVGEKALLRKASVDLLPEYILHRKKSPYPKTHNPRYEQILREKLAAELKKDTLFTSLIDQKALASFLNGENTTWFGQLMARPQMIAWLMQLSAWMDGRKVELV